MTGAAENDSIGNELPKAAPATGSIDKISDDFSAFHYLLFIILFYLSVNAGTTGRTIWLMLFPP